MPMPCAAGPCASRCACLMMPCAPGPLAPPPPATAVAKGHRSGGLGSELAGSAESTRRKVVSTAANSHIMRQSSRHRGVEPPVPRPPPVAVCLCRDTPLPRPLCSAPQTRSLCCGVVLPFATCTVTVPGSLSLCLMMSALCPVLPCAHAPCPVALCSVPSVLMRCALPMPPVPYNLKCLCLLPYTRMLSACTMTWWLCPVLCALCNSSYFCALCPMPYSTPCAPRRQTQRNHNSVQWSFCLMSRAMVICCKGGHWAAGVGAVSDKPVNLRKQPLRCPRRRRMMHTHHQTLHQKLTTVNGTGSTGVYDALNSCNPPPPPGAVVRLSFSNPVSGLYSRAGHKDSHALRAVPMCPFVVPRA